MALGLWFEKCILLLFLFRLRWLIDSASCMRNCSKGFMPIHLNLQVQMTWSEVLVMCFIKSLHVFLLVLYSYLVIFFSFRICILVNSSD